MCSISTNVPETTDWKCRCCMIPHLTLPPSLLIQRQQQEKKSRAPRQSGESEVSSQSTGHIPNFPPSQKHNEIQIALPKPWDALPNSGNHHHQIRLKSQNNSNIPVTFLQRPEPQHSSVSPNRLSEPSLFLSSVAMKSNYNLFHLVWNTKGYFFCLKKKAFVCLKWAEEHGIK